MAPVEGAEAVGVADEHNASFISRLFWCWVSPLIRLGFSRPLTEEDVTPSLERDDVSHHLEVFEERLRQDVADLAAGSGVDGGAHVGHKKGVNLGHKLGKSIWHSFHSGEYLGIVLKLVSDAATYVPPLCIPYFIRYAEDPSSFGNEIFIIAIVNLAAPFVTGFCNHQWYHLVMLDGMHARTALQAAVYSKLLRLRHPHDTIVNAQSTDCRAVEFLVQMWFYTWAVPLQIIVTTTLMYLLIGWPIFIGLTTVVGLVYLQQKVMALQFKYTATASASSDARIKLIGELIKGISVIKLNAWEAFFGAKVATARDKELIDRKKVAYIEAINKSVAEISNIMAMLLTFGAHALFVGETLTPERVFSTIALFSTLRMPITLMPMLVRMVAGGLVACRRLSTILYAEEIDSYVVIHSAEEMENSVHGKQSAIVVKGGTTFVYDGWMGESDGMSKEKLSAVIANTVHTELSAETKDGKRGSSEAPMNDARFRLTFGEDFCIEQGSFTVVTGRVASGKSSLLLSILGEMHPESANDSILDKSGNAGLVHIYGDVAYCAQHPWIQNGSLRENVLFEREYDEAAYAEVIGVCALEADLKSLPAGDATEIGERGINLSGGQKARVSLARACYSNASILLFDDILSAVDAHVGRHILDECLLGHLKNNGKTILLATHQASCFPRSDRFVVLEEGRLVFDGKFENAKVSERFSTSLLGASSGLALDLTKPIVEEETQPTRNAEVTPSKENSSETKVEENEIDAGANLVGKEAKETGAVSLATYRSYVNCVGKAVCLAILFLVIGVNVFSILSNWWLSRWADAAYSPDPRMSQYLWAYVGFGLSVCVFVLAFRLLFVYGGLRAGARIHKRMVTALLKAPQSYFDVTLSGRLLNLFTSDMKAIDEEVVSRVSELFNIIFLLFSVMVLVVVIIPLSAVAIAPLCVVYFVIQKVYRSTSRELKRFDSTSQSPIFNHLAEAFAGLSTIRAFHCGDRLLGETKKRIDNNSRFWVKNNSANRWLGLRLDFIGASLAGLTALAVVVAIYLGQQIDPGLVGLVLSYVTLFTGLLNWGVRNMSEAEQSLVAIERTRQLGLCPQEVTKDPLDVPDTWPAEGEIRFSAVSARYRPALPLVIKDLDLVIPSRAKVGVCGRTGSGKSTLAKLLFRVVDVESGSITIDGVDTSHVELSTLRGRMTMISQDPVLFAGSLRHSLDPADLYSETELREAVETVGLKDFLGDEGLEMEISEGGGNVSAGQRQLLCMARALVQRTSVLVMDEATSNMDTETDELIQRMLKDKFRECTVVTVAHRLHTILDYDLIVVMSDGRVEEFGPPGELQNKGGAFAAMLNEQSRGGA